MTPCRGRFVASDRGIEPIAPALCRLRLTVPNFPPSGPGQFVQLQLAAAAHESDAGLDARNFTPGRPFSIAGRFDAEAACELDIVFGIVGDVTARMARLRAGDLVTLAGPLGVALPAPNGGALFVLRRAGDAGRVLYLADRLRHAKTAAVVAPEAAAAMPLLESAGVGRVLTARDAGAGLVDSVDTLLEPSVPVTVYLTGPDPVAREIAVRCRRRHCDCRVFVSGSMPCGIGTCQGCAVGVRSGGNSAETDPASTRYRLACVDGPFFDAVTLRW